MSKEVALLAEEFALLRSVADDGGLCALAFDEALRPLFEPLLAEKLLVVRSGALCLTEMGRQLLLLTAGVRNGEPVAIARRRLQADYLRAVESTARLYEGSPSRISRR